MLRKKYCHFEHFQYLSALSKHSLEDYTHFICNFPQILQDLQAISGPKLVHRLALAKNFRKMPTSDFAFISVKPQLWKIVDYNTCQKQNCAEFKQCTANASIS